VDILDEYPILDMKLEQAKSIFNTEFLLQLKQILINGNYGDFVTAQDGLKIVEYFKQVNPKLQIEISTNASARPNIWRRLGELGVQVDFRIDGLQDTHKLYRQKTDFDAIIKNASEFISAGGYAVWMFILFDHNRHQVDQARKMASELGFREFRPIDHGRSVMPVFSDDKKLSHVIGAYQDETDFDTLYGRRMKYHEINTSEPNYNIDCYAKKRNEIYISASGEVYPCCWLGFYPMNNLNRPSNTQLRPLIKKNSALEYGIEESIQWFNEIEKTWSKDSVENGKLYECNRTCGIK
jgi:MoaA/NifB/PqqE/SkfB family radical SAM enzyme